MPMSPGGTAPKSRPGYKTTEFWTMVGGWATFLGGTVFPILPFALPVWVPSALSVAYQVSRGLAKIGPPTTPPTQPSQIPQIPQIPQLEQIPQNRR